jgi:serine/threonine protein kinase
MTSSCGSPSSSRGVKGVLVDTCCISTNPNPLYTAYDLCRILRSPQTEEVQLIHMTASKKLVTHRVSSFRDFSDFLASKRDILAIKYYYREADKDDELKQDLQGAVLLRHIYTRQKRFHSEYLTMNYELTYDDFVFNGIQIRHSGRNHYYFINNRCMYTLDQLSPLREQEFQKLVTDYLESFCFLEEKGYYHGDIKLQNMMYCPSKRSSVQYKLIDWGRLRSVRSFDSSYYYGGSKQAGSPLGFYFMFRNGTRSRVGIPMSYERAIDLSFALFDGKLPMNPVKSPLLQEYRDRFMPLWKEIQFSFRQTVESYKKEDGFFSRGLDSDEALFNHYKYTMDLYNFGLVLLYLIYSHHLSIERYYPFVERLVIYDKKMIRTASQAYREWKKITSSSKRGKTKGSRRSYSKSYARSP